MRDCNRFYIDGAWAPPSGARAAEVVNPATEQVVGRIALAEVADVDKAVAAARRAFAGYSRFTVQERVELLEAVVAAYEARYADIADAITEEMGAPRALSHRAQARAGTTHLKIAIEALKSFAFEQQTLEALIVKEPIGVAGLIAPWNWPANQIACKVAPALAVGCTIVLKPSEVSPFSAVIWSEVMHAAGVPAGVYNMVQGEGAVAGAAISSHPDIDVVSFTGSTQAGIAVAMAAAPTVKRVHQELGGKSPNILLPDADLPAAVEAGVRGMMMNSGQTCAANTRMLVPRARLAEAEEVAGRTADSVTVGDPNGNFDLGPVASGAQWRRVQSYIETGIAEGARLVAGGPGRPDGLDRGFYVRPTVFSDVTNDMTVAREEIFGPVLCLIAYDSVDQAVEIANDTPYGLSASVVGKDMAVVGDVARRLRSGRVSVNGAPPNFAAPFGGYKRSGNGREWGVLAFDEYLEVKAILAPA